MAGFSNRKFLAPSHFRKSDENVSENTSKNHVKTSLVPPSMYEKVEQSKLQGGIEEKSVKNVASLVKKENAEIKKENFDIKKENSELKQTINKLKEQRRQLSSIEDQNAVERRKKEHNLRSELHLAKRTVAELEQEKELLQYEVQDREALSHVVIKLKKELKRAKEKLAGKESSWLERVSNLKENCSKLAQDVKHLEKMNSELKKQLEAKEEDENEIAEKHRKRVLEVEIYKNEVNSLEEETRKIKIENERMDEDKKRIEENCERIEEEKIKVNKELLNEKEKCLHLESEMSLKDSLINELKESHKTKQEELNRVEREYLNKISAVETEYGLNICKLEEVIQLKDDVLYKEQQVYKESLQQKEDEIKDLVRSVEQLRSYIGDVRPNQESEKLSEKNQQLASTIEVLTEENNALHSTVKLLNVRLSCILEIVAIQETEFTRTGDVVGKCGDSEGLLRKWREKVFALMVQLQSQKIVESDQKRKEDVKLNALNAKLKDLEREHSVLNHKLADREAAMELEVNLGRKMSQELSKLKDDANNFQKQQKQWLTQFENLQRSAQAVEKTFLQSLGNLNRAVAKISSFDQRIKFAGSRIQFISEYLVHRDSQLKATSSDDKNTCHEVVHVIVDDSPENHEQHLQEEVEKLLKERAVLLNETRKHSETLKEKTLHLTQEYEAIIEQRNARIEKLEDSEAEVKERVHILQENHEMKSQELEQALESIEELKLILSKQKSTMEKVHREAFEKERLRNVEDMRNLEGQLNDVRREHTKAVAALKNAERQVKREKEQASKMVANIERELNEKLEKCQGQLKNVEKERNLLMVKIREDKKNISRLRPLVGSKVSKNELPVTRKPETRLKNIPRPPKQSAETSGTQGDTRDDKGQENVKPMDPHEALTALKELKMLSQQIVKMRGEEEISFSDAEC